VISLRGQQGGSQYNSDVRSLRCKYRYKYKCKEDKSVLTSDVSTSARIVKVTQACLLYERPLAPYYPL
jgi:hypothetical protein